MIDLIKAVKNILEEQGKTTQLLFDEKIISENTFYKYKQRYPSLDTLLKLANYLKVSIDYLFEFSDNNNFTPYSINNQNFYKNLISFINNKNISGRKFCKDLQYSRDNLIRWRNGTHPSIQSLLEIADYFNCTIDELLK